MATKKKSTQPAEKKPRKSSALEDRLYAQMVDVGLSPVREYQFCPDRRWRADLALPELKILIEAEGGLYGKPVICDKCKLPVMRHLPGGRRMPVRESGRHNTGAGFEKDLEKYNWAEVNGWMVIRISSSMVKSGAGIQVILDAAAAETERRNDRVGN